MNDLYKALFVAGLSFVVSILTYRYQFGRNRKMDFRSKIRYLYRLVKETRGIAKTDLKGIKAVISGIEKDDTILHPLTTSALQTSKILEELVNRDDYYSAYLSLFKNQLSAEDYLFELRYNSVFISETVEVARQMIQDFLVFRIETCKGILRKKQELFKVMDKIYPSDKQHENTATIQMLSDVMQNYIKASREDDVKTIVNTIAIPILDHYQRGLATSELQPIVELAIEIRYDYENIRFQNNDLKSKFSSHVDPFEKAIESMDKIYKFLSSSAIRPLFEK